MRKINVSNYKIKAEPTPGNIQEIDYAVKNSLINILLHNSLGLTGLEIYNRSPIADKIKNAEGEFLMLEDAEYEKLLSAVKSLKGFGANDQELVKRVIDAETVDVTQPGK